MRRLRPAPAVPNWGPAPSFEDLCVTLRAVPHRREILTEEIPPPRRIAPDAFALQATVVDTDDEELGSGRFVLLHDDAERPAWHAPYRVVAYVRAYIDEEMSTDRFLAQAAWSWVEEAIEETGIAATFLGGTVTRTLNEPFGERADVPPDSEIEIRASWSAAAGLPDHLETWYAMLEKSCALLPAGESLRPQARRRETRP